MGLEEICNYGENLVFVIGRGHSGTRAAAKLVESAGIFMGHPLNGTMDLVPEPNRLYAAAKIAGGHVHVQYVDRTISVTAPSLFNEPPPVEFVRNVMHYMLDGGILRALACGNRVGFKLPETTFCFPWIVRLFPRASYLIWGRNPRGVIRTPHGTDDLSEWNVAGVPANLTPGSAKALSCGVQMHLVLSAPQPERAVWTTLEEFCWRNDALKERISAVLGLNVRGPSADMNIAQKWRRCRLIADGTPEIEFATSVYEKWQHRSGWAEPDPDAHHIG